MFAPVQRETVSATIAGEALRQRPRASGILWQTIDDADDYKRDYLLTNNPIAADRCRRSELAPMNPALRRPFDLISDESGRGKDGTASGCARSKVPKQYREITRGIGNGVLVICRLPIVISIVCRKILACGLMSGSFRQASRNATDNARARRWLVNVGVRYHLVLARRARQRPVQMNHEFAKGRASSCAAGVAS